tara:strand:+ start:1544 stop:2296 length:753 start_codon:yes stop_codon:yes gene_type:complete
MTPEVIGGFGQIVGSVFSGLSARKARKEAEKEKKRLTKKLNRLEANRQEIINPYEGIQDLSSMISNPFANLSVATGAAEIQIEQADISLANTLDTMRATGASAGGATALAQAALQSKKGVAASIESQEKANEDKRAQGQQFMERRAVAEAERLQNADVSGREFVYSEQEKREQQQLDRTASLIGMAEAARAQATADQTSAISGGIGNLGAFAGSAFGKPASTGQSTPTFGPAPSSSSFDLGYTFTSPSIS